MRIALIGTSVALMMMIGSPVLATSGCCSWHGGVQSCNASGRDVCNDGTLSPTCTCAPMLHAAAPVVIKKSVSIKNMQFSPKTLTVKLGTTVTWTNTDTVPHTVTGEANGPASGTLTKGQSYSFTFSKVGTFSYHCTFHSGMTAKVTVTR